MSLIREFHLKMPKAMSQKKEQYATDIAMSAYFAGSWLVRLEVV